MRSRHAKKQLHITNGDSAANILIASTVTGEILPWRDCLHDGPVPGDLDTDAMADIRARHLALPQLGGYAGVRQGFAKRDGYLTRLREYDELVLWFEHDLYDQLQILQILDRLAGLEPGNTRLSMICIDRFPGVEPFHGLGQLDAGQMASLLDQREPIGTAQLALGRTAWRAFTADNPTDIEALLREDLSALPFLAAALRRLLQEYPSTRNGLGRTQQQILQCVARGIHRPGRLFAASQELEEAVYMGDWSFWKLIDGLIRTRHPLLSCRPGGTFEYPPDVPVDEAFRSQQLELTETGNAVLDGTADHVELNGIDLWLGGVHLQSGETVWRRDEAAGRLRGSHRSC